MAELVLTDLDDVLLHHLTERASRHGRTAAQEATAILADVVRSRCADGWASVDEIFHRLAASGRAFSDCADLVREDRDR